MSIKKYAAIDIGHNIFGVTILTFVERAPINDPIFCAIVSAITDTRVTDVIQYMDMVLVDATSDMKNTEDINLAIFLPV